MTSSMLPRSNLLLLFCFFCCGFFFFFGEREGEREREIQNKKHRKHRKDKKDKKDEKDKKDKIIKKRMLSAATEPGKREKPMKRRIKLSAAFDPFTRAAAAAITYAPRLGVEGEVSHPPNVRVPVDALREGATVLSDEHHLHASVWRGQTVAHLGPGVEPEQILHRAADARGGGGLFFFGGCVWVC